MRIISVTRRQLHEIYSKLNPLLSPEQGGRRMITELLIGNMYLQMDNILLVAADDVEFLKFPADKEITIASIVMNSVPHTEAV